MRASRWSKTLAVAFGLSLVAAACGDDDETSTDDTADETTTAPDGEPTGDFLACQVTDTGGVDDNSFNETAFAGLESAADELGFDPTYLESSSEADFEPNIDAHIDAGCDIIVTVGFLLGDATATAATDNPDQLFAIVDVDFFDDESGEDVTFDNVKELTFSTDEAAFLAGYLAAATTETGTVGTYGGINIPPVTIFMDGMLAGIEFYNEENDADVELVGWDGTDGLFTGDFTNTENGRLTTEQLLDEGADIIMPVAGPVGQGTIEAINAGGGGERVIWVDTDGCVSVPDACDLFLTSVMKNMDVAVHDAIISASDGSFEGGVYLGTLENGGVGIAPLNEFEDVVDQDIQDRLEELQEQIINGEVTVG